MNLAGIAATLLQVKTDIDELNGILNAKWASTLSNLTLVNFTTDGTTNETLIEAINALDALADSLDSARDRGILFSTKVQEYLATIGVGE